MSEMNIVRESGWEEEEEPVKGRAKKGVEAEPKPRTLAGMAEGTEVWPEAWLSDREGLGQSGALFSTLGKCSRNGTHSFLLTPCFPKMLGGCQTSGAGTQGRACRVGGSTAWHGRP